jgi:hypothetical protein
LTGATGPAGINAIVAQQVNVVPTTTNATFYPVFANVSTGNSYMYSNASGLNFNPNTNVLAIGTSSPTGAVHILNSIPDLLFLQSSNSATGSNRASIIFAPTGVSSTVWETGSRGYNADKTNGFYIYDKSRSAYTMIIDNLGQMAVGNTSIVDGSVTGSYPLAYTFAVGGSLYASSTITAGGAVTAFSDARLKSNVLPITNSLQKLLQLQGVTYQRTDTGDLGRGLIAQQVQKIYPELVVENKDGMLSVAYGNFVADVIEAIRELQDQIHKLAGSQ